MMNEIFLYPNSAPGTEGVVIEEKVFEEDYEDGLKKQIVNGVTKPSIIPFIPDKPNGMAVIVIPGGYYRRQVLNFEGIEIANWLNSLGITAFILKHRMPVDPHLNELNVPLQDAQRAMRIIRSNANKYSVEQNKIGVMGFSAGGHLAATIATSFDKNVYTPIDEADKISARPDFLVLGYPAISKHSYTDYGYTVAQGQEKFESIIEEYPSDKLITSDTPQAFIIVADDDSTTPSTNSVCFYLGLKRNGIPAELHIFKKGKHGFGLGTTKGAVAAWTKLCSEWLADLY